MQLMVEVYRQAPDDIDVLLVLGYQQILLLLLQHNNNNKNYNKKVFFTTFHWITKMQLSVLKKHYNKNQTITLFVTRLI